MKSPGKKENPASIAKRIQMAVFDFDGVFTDNRVLTLEDGREGVFCSRSDGFGLDALRRHGVRLLVLSKEKNPVVAARCKKLNILSIQGCDRKAEVLKEEAKKLGIPLKNAAYMGNDINDVECLEIVGLPACVSDAYPEVKEISLYVSKVKGGYGAVREFCDYIAAAKEGKVLS